MHGIDIIANMYPLLSIAFKTNNTIIEVGSSSEPKGSTSTLLDICLKHDLNFITIDPSDEACRNVNQILGSKNLSTDRNYIVRNEPAEKCLYKYNLDDVALVYMDGFDVVSDHPHKQSTLDKYSAQGIDLLKDGNDISAQVHLEATYEIYNHVIDFGFICFDDTWIENNRYMGKGAKAVPFLLQKGYMMIVPPSENPNGGCLLQNAMFRNKELTTQDLVK